MTKEFSISGVLKVYDVDDHQEMLQKLFEILRESNFIFAGETKEITDK